MNSYRIPEIAKQYTEYDMIQIHTDLPDFPELRTRLLFAFLNGNSKLSTSSELYTLATSLVQLALDTHELVTASNDIKEKKAARSRQLKVLAGDYFSSRFYHLLAGAGQIDMIKQLSNAICDVNRLKMNTYMKMKQLKLSAEDYIHQTVEIKSQLFLSFSEFMSEVYDQAWPEILRSYTKCEVLFEEIFRLESASDFKGSWGFWHILQHGTKDERKQLQTEESDQAKVRTLVHKYHIPSQLYQMLDSQTKLLQAKVKQLESDKLISELFHIGEPFLRFLAKQPKVLEEI
ncbi:MULTISPECIES: heptaprenyl diphosphate synthase component 1 [Paenibacillus]|uniref:Heptaprenyl diphosphate synthase component 1 n=2 Tax=Paenibacillus TaxID=44249 RepID=A0ABU6DNB0_9BACL|nr:MULTISPECIES: heptaprenyl diphosphate synthase component 1 [Paenibacillus]MBA2942275.1 heptaprenyl diphosphate synthase component 1 [Paenibacillus sp. CGMCC 1.16610]MCY9657185.1 heptaprenyl diphosphate synthase component 1 [Paenibacillus anseongense]MEB4798468.1 heptaprenyl diphosphate synthase component 1 [Paenibacillus chondroitinus]MVQ36107.1 heptaprenyl diphosphate synthase [Paenibacillus anseongense]